MILFGMVPVLCTALAIKFFPLAIDVLTLAPATRKHDWAQAQPAFAKHGRTRLAIKQNLNIVCVSVHTLWSVSFTMGFP